MMVREEYYVDPMVDNYLNFCFAFNLSIDDSLAGNIAALGPYYRWLLQPDAFDYSLFDYNWVFHHFTIHFKRWLRKSKRLKEALLQLIKQDTTTDTERIFILIYSFDD